MAVALLPGWPSGSADRTSPSDVGVGRRGPQRSEDSRRLAERSEALDLVEVNAATRRRGDCPVAATVLRSAMLEQLAHAARGGAGAIEW